MIYADLLIGFLKVGCFAFGGAYAAIPLIREVVLDYGWINDELLSQMIAVSESTPGPIMVNLATYVGTNQGGVLGGIIATLSVVLPSFLVTILVMVVLKSLLKNKITVAILDGLKPCIIGVILSTGIYMACQNILPAFEISSVDVRAIIITVLLVIIMKAYKLIMKKAGKGNKKMSPIMLIIVSAVLGAVIYAV